jgi:hypothetical protein
MPRVPGFAKSVGWQIKERATSDLRAPTRPQPRQVQQKHRPHKQLTLPEPAEMKEFCVEGASSTEETVNWCLPSRMIIPAEGSDGVKPQMSST